MIRKFFKTLTESEDFGLRMGNRWGWGGKKTKRSPQGFSKPWMTKFTPKKGFWVKITKGVDEGKAYPAKKGDKRLDYYGKPEKWD